MLGSKFHSLVNSEIENLGKQLTDNPDFIKRDDKGKLSFSFLFWFLREYLPNEEISSMDRYITEGDGDHSCDIIFNNLNKDGKEDIFYVVQAKWVENFHNRKHVLSEIKSTIEDFRLVLSGKKKSNNKKFNRKYKELLIHKKSNRKISFIFLILKDMKSRQWSEIELHIDNFKTELVDFSIYDLNKLKKDYIDTKYRGIKSDNMLEHPHEPKCDISLNIFKENFIKIERPINSFIVLLSPLEIFKLYDKYGIALFYKNIRNPLVKSLINPAISSTLKNDPAKFWYYNNGITAITKNIYPFHKDNNIITIKGIQIINGAQTFYSIYNTYKNADYKLRRKINKAFVTLRILKTGGQNFDLDVTRYTNSQNSVNERDFHSHDEVQKRIQNDFFDFTNIWYEIRRSEFRSKPRDIKVITNETFGQRYLAYYLEEPFKAKSKKKLIFLSEKFDQNGLYENIFNEKTNYKDLLVGYYIFEFIEKKRKILQKEFDKYDDDNPLNFDDPLYNKIFIYYASFDILALFKFIFTELYDKNFEKITNIIISDYEKNNKKHIEIIYNYIINRLEKFFIDKKEPEIVHSVYFKKSNSYKEMRKYIKSKLSISSKRKLSVFK